jgi:hypothetical protein
VTDLSVILCTHNPREDYLRRVLAALREQTLPKEQWELLLIDNASGVPLAGRWDLAWHPRARHIREAELGLTPARLRGIRESVGDLLVFVDDDNVLAANYLEEALRIATAWPILGAWGGSILPEFEAEPPEWVRPYLSYLALREVTEDRWSNWPDDPGRLPWGAGMCVRSQVAKDYAAMAAKNPVRKSLDRRGNSCTSCGDTDLAMTACDMGFGTGLFRSLRLTHLIPAERLEEPYVKRLLVGMNYSLVLLAALRGRFVHATPWPRSLWNGMMALRRGFRSFRLHRATQAAMRKALHDITKWELTVPPISLPAAPGSVAAQVKVAGERTRRRNL